MRVDKRERRREKKKIKKMRENKIILKNTTYIFLMFIYLII